MDITTIIVGCVVAVSTLLVNYVVSKVAHSGNVRSSDAETVFKASESVRNDMAVELVACRKDRDHYFDQLNKCLEGKGGRT